MQKHAVKFDAYQGMFHRDKIVNIKSVILVKHYHLKLQLKRGPTHSRFSWSLNPVVISPVLEDTIDINILNS